MKPTLRWLTGRVLTLVVALVSTGGMAAGSSTAVVASRGGASVTLADVDRFVENIPAQDRPRFFDSPQRIESLINNLLLQKQLAAEAREAGLDQQPQFQAPLGDPSDAALAKAEVARFRAALPKPDIEQMAKEEYLAHKEKYAVPAVLDVRHVLVKAEGRTEEEARALAEKVHGEAVADPSRFPELVEKYSDDPRKAEEKGLLHEAGSPRYVAEFAAAARALAKPGDVSPVVHTKYGYHVLQLVAKSPDEPRSFEDVHDEIVAALTKRYEDEAVQRHADTLRNLPIEANPDLVASLRTRYGEAPAIPEPGAQKPARP